MGLYYRQSINGRMGTIVGCTCICIINDDGLQLQLQQLVSYSSY